MPTGKRISNAAIRKAWLDPDLTAGQAAAVVGLTRSNLWLRVKALGLPPRRPGRRETCPRGPEFVAMWRAGVRAADIAAHFGCHVLTVSRVAAELGLKKRRQGTKPVPLLRYRMQVVAQAENAALAAQKAVPE